jgi:hypothetical protein
MVNPLLPPESAIPAQEKSDPKKTATLPTLDADDLEPLQEKSPADLVFPRRNIFAVNLNYFPKSAARNDKDLQGNKPLDPEQFQLNALQEQAMGFQVQSTMTGPVPTAYIDGNLVREKETYKGFTVRKIQDGKVTLEAKGHLYTLFLNEK